MWTFQSNLGRTLIQSSKFTTTEHSHSTFKNESFKTKDYSHTDFGKSSSLYIRLTENTTKFLVSWSHSHYKVQKLKLSTSNFVTTCLDINRFVPNVPFLYSLKTSENYKVFWCFQGVEKGWIGNEWVYTKKQLYG